MLAFSFDLSVANLMDLSLLTEALFLCFKTKKRRQFVLDLAESNIYPTDLVILIMQFPMIESFDDLLSKTLDEKISADLRLAFKYIKSGHAPVDKTKKILFDSLVKPGKRLEIRQSENTPAQPLYIHSDPPLKLSLNNFLNAWFFYLRQDSSFPKKLFNLDMPLQDFYFAISNNFVNFPDSTVYYINDFFLFEKYTLPKLKKPLREKIKNGLIRKRFRTF